MILKVTKGRFTIELKILQIPPTSTYKQGILPNFPTASTRVWQCSRNEIQSWGKMGVSTKKMEYIKYSESFWLRLCFGWDYVGNFKCGIFGDFTNKLHIWPFRLKSTVCTCHTLALTIPSGPTPISSLNAVKNSFIEIFPSPSASIHSTISRTTFLWWKYFWDHCPATSIISSLSYSLCHINYKIKRGASFWW